MKYYFIGLLMGVLLGAQLTSIFLVRPAQKNTNDAIATIAKWKAASEGWESNTKAAMAVSVLWETAAKQNESSVRSCLKSSRELLKIVEATK